MKSKKSFFNKTLFMKNVVLYWPLWVVYTVFLFCMQPGTLWVYNYNINFRIEYDMTDRLRYLISSLEMEGYIVLIAFFAIFFGMALYNYLYNSKNANMIHALPVDRTQLFGTNVVSGLSFLIVPQIFVSILSVIVCLAYGITRVDYIGIWLLMAMGTAVVAFSVVTFCAMFTGLLVALPAYVIIVNLLSHWVYYIIYVVVTTFGYGITGLGAMGQKIAEMTSPFVCFMGYVSIYRDYDLAGNLRGIGVSGVNILCVYLVIAVVLYVLSYVIYQKRKIESAGDLITIGWVKPVFRYGVGLSGGIFFGILLRELFRSLGIPCPMVVTVVLMLVLGAISYFAADMLVKKSFHVFKKKNWIGCGVFSVALLFTFFGLYAYSNVCEDRMPEEEHILSASINMGYEVNLDEEEAGVILDIHKQILEEKEFVENYLDNGGYKYEYVSIRYTMDNGEVIRRSYALPYEYENTKAIILEIQNNEMIPENFYRYMFGTNYNQITEFGGGWVEMMFESRRESEYYAYESISLTQQQAEKIYQAILADTKSGNLIRYNVYWNDSIELMDHKYSEAYLMIEYKQPKEEITQTLINMSENSIGYDQMIVTETAIADWSSCHINFGPDCENIVNALIEFGIIDSADEIYWGE